MITRASEKFSKSKFQENDSVIFMQDLKRIENENREQETFQRDNNQTAEQKTAEESLFFKPQKIKHTMTTKSEFS